MGHERAVRFWVTFRWCLTETLPQRHRSVMTAPNQGRYSPITMITNSANGAAGGAKTAIGGGVVDRALGTAGLFLMVLVTLATGWGWRGRVVIWLVTAIGWVIDHSPRSRKSDRVDRSEPSIASPQRASV